MNPPTDLLPNICQEDQKQKEAEKALALYREGVEELWKLKSEQFISNGEPSHAAILFASFFNHAEKQVRILCSKLAAAVFGQPEVIKAAKGALSRGVCINVILQGEAEQSGFKELLDEGKVQSVNGGSKVSSLKMNFAVMDDLGWRYEKDNGGFAAQASMHDPKNAKNLVRYFDTLWTSLSQGA
jgi:hypothetical protein